MVAQGEAQMELLRSLQQRVSHSGIASLASLRAEIAASVAVTQSVGQLARAAVAIAHGAKEALEAVSTTAHNEVTGFIGDFYEKKIFDPYLRFDSPEDEEEYRKREREREHAIRDALALGTPEGNLLATDLAIAQLKDAGEHGADASPEFQSAFDRLRNVRADLGATIAEGTQVANGEPSIAALLEPSTDVSISPELLASLRDTGVAFTDQSQEGHGVHVGVGDCHRSSASLS